MRIFCKTCGIALTKDLKEWTGKSPLQYIDQQPLVPQGFYCTGDEEYYRGSANKLMINKSDLINATNHTNISRLNGCCGLDGCDGPNKLCTNGHEVATEYSDCWMAEAVIFENDAIIVK